MQLIDAQESRRVDISLAQKICDELRSNNKSAILGLYNRYHPFFLEFTKKRVFSPDPDKVETVLTDFWVELLNGNAICGYEGRASLRTYLITILRRRIIDRIRKNGRTVELTPFNDEKDCSESDNGGFVSPEQDLVQKERQKLIHEALVMLSLESPRDALLIRLYLEDLNYREMAERELTNVPYSNEEVDRKANAIKKQMTRKESGSFVKFEVCMGRCLKNRQMKLEELFN